MCSSYDIAVIICPIFLHSWPIPCHSLLPYPFALSLTCVSRWCTSSFFSLTNLTISPRRSSSRSRRDSVLWSSGTSDIWKIRRTSALLPWVVRHVAKIGFFLSLSVQELWKSLLCDTIFGAYLLKMLHDHACIRWHGSDIENGTLASFPHLLQFFHDSLVPRRDARLLLADVELHLAADESVLLVYLK
jgi:hypothetical protein